MFHENNLKMKPRQALSPSSRQGGRGYGWAAKLLQRYDKLANEPTICASFLPLSWLCCTVLHTLCKVRLSAQSAQVAVLPWRDREQIKTNHLKRTTQTTPTRTKRQKSPLWVKLAFRRSSYLYALFGSYALLSRKTLLSRMRYALFGRMLCLARMIAGPRSLFCHRQATLAVSGVLALPLSLSSYALIFG